MKRGKIKADARQSIVFIQKKGSRYNETMYHDIADLLAYQEGGRKALVEKGLDEEGIAQTEENV